MEMENQPIYCKRLVLESDLPNGTPSILLGKILDENDLFLTFRTGRGKEYLVSKRSILRVEDTLEPFREEP